MSVSEYFNTITVNTAQMRNIQLAQQRIYDSGLIKENSNELIQVLGGVSSILGLAFIASTPVSVATAVMGVIASMSDSTEAVLDKMVHDGSWYMTYAINAMASLDYKYDLFELQFPFIEYTDKNIRFITGNYSFVRAHYRNGSGWVSLH